MGCKMFSYLIFINSILIIINHNHCDGKANITRGVKSLDSVFPNLLKSNAILDYSSSENEAKKFLKILNKRMEKMENKAVIASWNFVTNLTLTNSKIADEAQLRVRRNLS